MPVAIPRPWIMATEQGEIPGWKLAPLRKVMFVGPGSTEVSENDVLTEPTEAVMVIGPALCPADTATCARPFASVFAVAALSVAEPPATAKATWAPETGLPLASVTRTTIGAPKAVPVW